MQASQKEETYSEQVRILGAKHKEVGANMTNHISSLTPICHTVETELYL